MNTIPVIDLFAGPGGLSEGFSALKKRKIGHPFRIALSIEKDSLAHKTLELRSFFRKFLPDLVPPDYYDYLRGLITREQLFERYPVQSKAATAEAWNAELGNIPHSKVIERIKQSLNGTTNWVLIGGPPCQAYSVVGRVRMKAKNSENFEKDHRHFLYREYLKIIRDLEPPVFVMENVTGILSSKMNNKYIFDKILGDLSFPSGAFRGPKKYTAHTPRHYHIYSLVKNKKQSDFYEKNKNDYVIKCEKYGIPQRRHRVILLGVRSDLNVRPRLLLESRRETTLWDVVGDLPKLRSGITDQWDSLDNWKNAILEMRNCPWLQNGTILGDLRKYIRKRLSGIKDDLDLGNEYVLSSKSPKFLKQWFSDAGLQGACNHSARKHIKKDLHRYFYAACFAKKYAKSPKIKDFPKAIWPKHENILKAFEGSMFSDRFRVQLKNKPSTTITCHIAKDGHYFIHPDSAQCRSLTVREAARLQTFPDNYFFEGPRTAQYGQVGNAVPPLLANKIAQIVCDIFRQLD